VFELMSPFFQKLYDETGWNFVIFYEQYEWDRFLAAIAVSFQLIVACLFFSLVVGIVGAWAQGSPIRALRLIMAGYIQLFRNTPPYVQLLFFFFVLGNFTPQVDKGGYFEPLITSFGWAVISMKKKNNSCT